MKKKILVVDDDKDIAEPLCILLEGQGYEVEAAYKGDETYKKVEQFKPDLILLDVLISGSDGRLICQNLKQQKQTQFIPIVMMSAHPTAQAESKKCGADDFLAKPFDIDKLYQKIKTNLKQQG